MHRIASGNRPAAIASLSLSLSLSLAMTVAPASPARAEDVPMPSIPVTCPPAAAATPVKPYYAYRPVYRVPGTRPLYLSNYAGANYPSRSPGAAVTPTEFRVLTGRDQRPRWNWFGLVK